ncbi:hypothetical protein BJV77DRAFT_1033201, partial [Russula vinacea]
PYLCAFLQPGNHPPPLGTLHVLVRNDWARRLSACLPPLAHCATSVLPSLTDLANWYFNHLGLALLDLSGKKTPDVSLSPVPDTDRLSAIELLFHEAKEQTRKPALKLLVQLRDTPTCPVTGLEFRQSEHEKLGIFSQIGVGPELAHIIPFSLHSKTQAHVALEAFTDVVECVNAPENALLLQHDAHQEYANLLSWGIEAVSDSDGIVRYYSRLVRPRGLSSLTKYQMNKELLDNLICLPDPRFCNTMLAIMRVLHASGVADMLDELREVDEHSRMGGSGMGISNTFDDLLSVKLDLASMSSRSAGATSHTLDPGLMGGTPS